MQTTALEPPAASLAPATSLAPADVVRAAYAAYNSGRLDESVGYLAPDAEWSFRRRRSTAGSCAARTGCGARSSPSSRPCPRSGASR